jgi:hypothetical protein
MVGRRAARLAIAIVAAGCAAGCAGPAGEGGEPVQSSPPVATTGQLPLVTVTCTGGVAGVVERLQVQPDGTVTGAHRTDQPGSGRLTAEERTALAAAVARAAQEKYRPEYTTEGAADLFVYRIEFGAVSVSADQQAIPGPLAAVIDALAPARHRFGLTC